MPAHDANIIELDDVSKRFGAPGRGRAARNAVVALRELSLGIPRGRVSAIVGPNGAGKSTLFALVLGFLYATKGDVRVAGQEPRAYARKHGAGYLPERFSLPPEWPVGAALRSLARLEKMPRDEADTRAETQLERFGLAEHADKRVGALSRGLLQRLGLAQALLADHELVVLDEPTEGLDPLWRVRLRGEIDELRGANRTVLLASHELDEVERLADHVFLLDDGRLRRVLEPRERHAAGPQPYRITLAAALPAVNDAFPGASRIDDTDAAPAGERGDADDAAAYRVEVGSAHELSERLAALIAAGGQIVAVAPLETRLGDRVRRTLEEDET